MAIAKLDRKILKISGDGVTEWLSGLVTNNLDNHINFTALLTPQGKIIADFFAIRHEKDWWLDVAAKYSDSLIKRLSMYKLRAPITIEPLELDVCAAWGGTGHEGVEDPRHPELGRRIYGQGLDCEVGPDAYDQHRLTLGIPDSAIDFETGETFPANTNMDLLNGVDFKKGCFVGQEVVSRMYRKTDVKKRMRGFSFSGDLISEDIKAGERVIGSVMHHRSSYGMAMIRHDRLPDDNTPLMIDGREIKLLDLPDGHST